MRAGAFSFATLERLADIARAAGRAVMAVYRQPFDVERKSDSSPLTAADRAAHSLIVSELERWDPSIPIISEEGDQVPYERRRHWPRFWLVDPLDGTKEFISRNGEFTVNIALIEGTEPVLGVVGAPALDLLYVAGRKLGAWRSTAGGAWRRIVAPEKRDSGVTRIVESRSHPSPELEEFLMSLGNVERIRLGSSLKFCRVAEGEADVYPRFGRTMEWDVAAGDCIFRNSAPDGRERPSPLAYNQPTLSAPGFIIGESDAHLSAIRGPLSATRNP